MAVDVGKSLSETSLSGKAEGSGRWDCAEVETDCLELTDSLRWFLGPEEPKPFQGGMENVATSCLVTGATQGSASYHQEVSSASASRFPRARRSLSEAETIICRVDDDDDVSHHVSHRFLSSEEQQVKASDCWEPTSSPPSQHSSAYKSILASHIQHSQRLGAQTTFSSTPKLLQPQPPPSPEITVQSRSTSCFSALSSGDGRSEEPSSRVLVGTVLPFAATTTRALHRQWGVMGDGAVRVREPFTPQVDSRLPVDRTKEMSPYQAEYWACAIPDSLPPSPDRRSPRWNPHKEYEDLLDYAYPLKPWYRLGKIPEPFFHDSGIGLDSISISAEGTPRSTSIYSQGRQVQGGGENGHRRFVASTERFLNPRPGKRGCSGAASCFEPLPLAKEFSFTKSDVSRGCAKDGTTESDRLGSSGRLAKDGRSWCARGTPCPSYQGQMRSSHAFVPTTQVLPLRKECEDDEEFLSLPPRLRELEQLAQFLSGLSLTIGTPGHNHQNLSQGSDSRDLLSVQVAPFGEASGGDSRGDVEDGAGPQLPRSSQKPSWENTKSSGWIHMNLLQGLQLPTGLEDTLDGTSLSEPRVRGHPKNQQSESLAQCIKMFCHQLEELIRWLYSIADIPGSCIPALPDTESVTASLRRCLEFRKDVAEHRSLTEQVLERGEALLDCMAANSPALKDTLGLIVEQSEALEAHVEHMYESILAAAEATQDRDRTEDDGVQQMAAQWVLGQPRDG